MGQHRAVTTERFRRCESPQQVGGIISPLMTEVVRVPPKCL